MSRHLRTALAALCVVCSLGLACIPFEEAEKEFCENAGPEQQHLCPKASEGDGGTRPSAGDAGPPPCVTTSDCATPPQQCVNSGVCVEGKCFYPPAADGTACSATHTERCRESTGTCQSGSCVYTAKTSGACDDGNSCTFNDACNEAGNCIGTASVCNEPPNQCHEPAGRCSPDTGACHHDYKPAAATCNDGVACTTNDRCDGAGICTGTPLECEKNTPACMKWTGRCSNDTCIYEPNPGASCNDNNLCTVNDTCDNNGACKGTAKTCANKPENQCSAPTGTCNEDTGNCDYPPNPIGTACDDKNACTVGDVCNGSGQCIEGEPSACPDRQQECMIYDRCDPVGGCAYRSRCAPNQYCREGQCCTSAVAPPNASGVTQPPICVAP